MASARSSTCAQPAALPERTTKHATLTNSVNRPVNPVRDNNPLRDNTTNRTMKFQNQVKPYSKPMKTMPCLVAVLLVAAASSEAQIAQLPGDLGTGTNAAPVQLAVTNTLQAVAALQLQSQAVAPPAISAADLFAMTNAGLSGLSSATVEVNQVAPSPVLPQEIQTTDTGATAQWGPHKAFFAANANTSGAIQLLAPQRGGQLLLRSHVLGLCYYDPSSGQSVLFASLQDSMGKVSLPGTVTYSNALAGTVADIRYSYRSDSIEQDIVLRKQLPDPQALGFNANTVMLGVITEFLDPPEPLRAPETIDLSANNKALGIEGLNSLACESLFFGSMRVLGVGKAFLLGDSGSGVPTGTSFENIGLRHFLVESAPYALIAAQIASLPAGTLHAKLAPRRALKTMLAQSSAPAMRKGPTAKMYVVQETSDSRPGFVLDYQMVTTHLINVDCGGSNPEKLGFAAVGQATNDFWTTCAFSSTPVSLPNLKWSDSTN